MRPNHPAPTETAPGSEITHREPPLRPGELLERFTEAYRQLAGDTLDLARRQDAEIAELRRRSKTQPITSIDLETLKAATDRIFEHRKVLRTVAVRMGFWPDGLRIAAGGSPDLVPWAELATISREDLLARIDRVCGVTGWEARISTKPETR